MTDIIRSTTKVYVPGRVCMIGEHSDWAAGYRSEAHPDIEPGCCLAYCTDVGIELEGEVIEHPPPQSPSLPSQSKEATADVMFHYRFMQPQSQSQSPGEATMLERRIPFDYETLEKHAKAGDFFAHVCGATAEMLHRKGDDLFATIRSPSSPFVKSRRAKFPSAADPAAATAMEAQQQEREQQPPPQSPIATIRITCTGASLPIKKGLSSSAACGVAVARLLGKLSASSAACFPEFDFPSAGDRVDDDSGASDCIASGNGNGNGSGALAIAPATAPTTAATTSAATTTDELTREQEMDVAYHGEHRTGSQCGRLDQVCAFGRGAFVKLVFTGAAPPLCTPLAVKHVFRFVVADLNAHKDTKVILRDLNSAYPEPQSDIDRNVHVALGRKNHEHIARAERALRDGDAEALGRVFADAQRVFDEMVAPKCPAELAAPRLHAVLADADVRAASLGGGKGVGSNGDGSVQFVVRDAAQQQRLCEILEQKLKCAPMKFSLLPEG